MTDPYSDGEEHWVEHRYYRTDNAFSRREMEAKSRGIDLNGGIAKRISNNICAECGWGNRVQRYFRNFGFGMEDCGVGEYWQSEIFSFQSKRKLDMSNFSQTAF
jgi:hypothetical protein